MSAVAVMLQSNLECQHSFVPPPPRPAPTALPLSLYLSSVDFHTQKVSDCSHLALLCFQDHEICVASRINIAVRPLTGKTEVFRTHASTDQHEPVTFLLEESAQTSRRLHVVTLFCVVGLYFAPTP
jgi:hypothetical protein